jgi:hypothetical protein
MAGRCHRSREKQLYDEVRKGRLAQDVAYWHFSEVPVSVRDVCLSGRPEVIGGGQNDAIDPTRTFEFARLGQQRYTGIFAIPERPSRRQTKRGKP